MFPEVKKYVLQLRNGSEDIEIFLVNLNDSFSMCKCLIWLQAHFTNILTATGILCSEAALDIECGVCFIPSVYTYHVFSVSVHPLHFM